MVAICNGTDLSSLIGYGYTVEQVPQYGGQMTALDGTDHSVKLRDRWHLKVPFIALTKTQLSTVLSLFPSSAAYVQWTFYDESASTTVVKTMRYEARKASLMVHYNSGVEYWSGLSVELWEQ